MNNLHHHLCKNSGPQFFGLRSALAFSLLALLTNLVGSVHAQTPEKPNKWVVSISDDPDPVPSGGAVSYKVSAKNDGPVQSTDVQVTITPPFNVPGVQFVSCKTSYDTETVKYCLGVIAGQVIAAIPRIKAHKTVNVTVVVNVPKVTAATTLTLLAKAEGKSAFKGDDTEKTKLLPPETTATMLPSGRSVKVFCDSILDDAFFQADNIMALESTLGCTKTAPFGLKIAKSGVTLDLQGNKIVVSGTIAGNVGVVIGTNATNVTIEGGGTDGTNGIENFDWCVQDEGGNTGLVVKNLRCYKARSAALDIVSDNVDIEKVKIDSTAPAAKTTEELPGGIGIHARGDNIRIKDTIVRRSKLIGILADGVDTDLSDYATTIDGNTRSSRVESANGIGVVFRNGPHLLKDSAVYGDGPDEGTSTHGVVVDTGMANRIEGAVVKQFNGHGVLIHASGTVITNTKIEKVAQHGFVISPLASNTLINGSSSKKLYGHGFVVQGDTNHLVTLRAEENLGSGYYISGNGNHVESSSAKINEGNGFVVPGNSNLISTNKTEKNVKNGFSISGAGNHVENSSAKSNAAAGFVISGTNNKCATNSTENNNGQEWSIGVNNIDGSGNAANKKRFSFTAAGIVIQ